MRHLVLCAILLAAWPASAAPPPRGVTTVLLDFQGEVSPAAVAALQDELSRLMSPTGVEFGYRIGSELGPGPEPTDIIVVRFQGKCRRDTYSPILKERGPFAITHVSNGEILPYAEVACDSVQSSLRTLPGRPPGHVSDALLGRALARVVAHEMYHIIAKTPHHGRDGLARPCFTNRDLVAENFDFSESDRLRIMRR